uniref:Uncharacterized protein n=1 Tax=Rhizophora mucronata TaxID=61149 RepID=A0A2P2R3X4_RHIMU
MQFNHSREQILRNSSWHHEKSLLTPTPRIIGS